MTRVAHVLVLLLVVVFPKTSPLGADDRADLSLAIRQGLLDKVTAIVDKNPGLVTSADDGGFTPLHIAATAGRVDIIEFLLHRGADIEARTGGGQTPDRKSVV